MLPRATRRGHRCGGALIGATVVATLVPVCSASAHSFRVAPVQRLAQVMTVHGVRARPDGHARVVEVVQPRRPLTNERTILPVLRRARGPQGVTWLQVRLPGRPNGHTGWIRQSGTVGATTKWAVVIDLARREVQVYRLGRRMHTFQAVVGKPSTPTPQGSFFVEEWFQIIPGHAGGPYALRAQRPLQRLPGVRRRPGPDRAARDLRDRRPAGERGVARLHPARHDRHGVARHPRPRGRARDDRPLAQELLDCHGEAVDVVFADRHRQRDEPATSVRVALLEHVKVQQRALLGRGRGCRGCVGPGRA